MNLNIIEPIIKIRAIIKEVDLFLPRVCVLEKIAMKSKALRAYVPRRSSTNNGKKRNIKSKAINKKRKPCSSSVFFW